MAYRVVGLGYVLFMSGLRGRESGGFYCNTI